MIFLANNLKKNLAYLFILIPIIICSQNSHIKDIELEDISTEQHIYNELLKLQDENALIVQFGYSTNLLKGLGSNLIVYLNNGQIKLYKIFELFESELKPKIKRVRIKQKVSTVLGIFK